MYYQQFKGFFSKERKKERILDCLPTLSFPLSSVADEDPVLMSLFHHCFSPAAKCWLELEPPHDWTHLLGAERKEKKRKKNSSFNSFCLSLPTHLLVFCEVEIGNAQQMCQGDIPNRIEVLLPRWVKHRGGEKSPACFLSLSDCLISRSNLGFWLSRHFWGRREEKRGET